MRLNYSHFYTWTLESFIIFFINPNAIETSLTDDKVSSSKIGL